MLLLSGNGWQVVWFNGIPVRNLKHLATLVEKCTDPFLWFDLDYQQVCVQNANLCSRCNLEVL